MLACLAVVPVLAIYGKQLQEFGRAVWETYQTRIHAKAGETSSRRRRRRQCAPLAGADDRAIGQSRFAIRRRAKHRFGRRAAASFGTLEPAQSFAGRRGRRACRARRLTSKRRATSEFYRFVERRWAQRHHADNGRKPGLGRKSVRRGNLIEHVGCDDGSKLPPPAARPAPSNFAGSNSGCASWGQRTIFLRPGAPAATGIASSAAWHSLATPTMAPIASFTLPIPIRCVRCRTCWSRSSNGAPAALSSFGPIPLVLTTADLAARGSEFFPG